MSARRAPANNPSPASRLRTLGACRPFERVAHLTRVEARLPGGDTARFLVDTGIGQTIVGSRFVERLGLERTGEAVSGRRMSGQAVTAPVVVRPALHLGGHWIPSGRATLVDLGSPDGPDGFDGIFGPDLLGELPLTVDPFEREVILGADNDDVEVLTARMHRDGQSVGMYVDLTLPSGRVVSAEVDTGSGVTILTDRFMADCGVVSEEATHVAEGEDETGHAFVRRWIPVRGTIAVAGHPNTAHVAPTVMFQEIELDGLIGTDFLDRWVQTYDTRTGTIALGNRSADT